MLSSKLTHIEPASSTSDTLYSLDELKDKFVFIDLTHNAWLFIHTDDINIEFFCAQFACSDGDSKNTKVIKIFEGSGPSGNLRECRHIWWGEDGYTFYLPAKAVIKALSVLSQYFDFNE